MNILILSEGGRNIGFGHITRCISLYEAFAKQGIEPELIVNADNAILGLLKGKRYKIFNWLMQENRLLQMAKDSNIIIIDSYLAPKFLFEQVFKITKGKLAVIDDSNRLEYPAGIVISPSIYGDQLGYAQNNGATYLLGKDYIILRKEFWNIPEKKINKKAKNILLTFGGTVCSHFIDKIISSLKAKFNFNFYVIDPKKDMLDVEDVFKQMLKADICISAGGQTTYELARVGVPTVGICFAENQRLNLEWWQKKGFIKYVGWYDQNDLLDSLTTAISELVSLDERKKCSRLGKSYVDGKGAARVIDSLLNKG